MPNEHWDRPWSINTYRQAVNREPKALNEGFMGVIPYGPRPLIDHVRDVLVFYPGGHGEFAFECKELCAAFLWKVYQIPSYQANGNEIVRNYRTSMPGKKLVAIPNDSAPPCPVPGDVLAYGNYVPGHTSVCIQSNVDAQGNGSITVMEQNNSASGKRVLTVINWKVYATLPITGFLHLPKGEPVPPPPTPGASRYFPETNQILSNAFKAFWESEEKALQYWGYPVTNEIREILSDGQTYTVQYFQRARFEYHPELPEGQRVLLGLIGVEIEAFRTQRHPMGD